MSSVAELAHQGELGHGGGAAGASAGDDELLIAALKRRLRGARGPEPKDQHVRIAVALACDTSLVPTTVCKAAVPPITSSGTRTQIIGYRDRILRDGLVDVCSSLDPATTAQSVQDWLAVALRRMKKSKQRRAQRAHWAEIRAVVSGLVDQTVKAHSPVITTLSSIVAQPSPPPAVPSHHVASSFRCSTGGLTFFTSYFLLLTSHFLLLAAYCLLLTSYFLLLTSYFLLLTSTSYF